MPQFRLLAVCLATCSFAAAQSTTRVNLGPGSVQANKDALNPSNSRDGRYVAFQSSASNLAFPPDPNFASDVFRLDRATGSVQRASISSSGMLGNFASFLSTNRCLSADGRCLVFDSTADNLVPGDTNLAIDTFVHDFVSGATTRVSVSSVGNQATIFGTTASVISADGRFVAFETTSSELVPDDTNLKTDVFVHDRATATTTRVSVDSAGGQGNGESRGPALSADGRLVAFMSWSSNLVAGDTNSALDVFVKDTITGQTERVSVTATGAEALGFSSFPVISADGRHVAFTSSATNLVGGLDGSFQLFVKDRVSGGIVLASMSEFGAPVPGATSLSLSDDGRFVSFSSALSNVVSGDTNGVDDVFVRDLVAGTTTRISVSSGGVQGNGASAASALSGDGRSVVFDSVATNLVPGDTNGLRDVFVREEYDVAPATYCTAKTSSHGCVPSIVGVGEPSVANPGGFSVTTAQLEQAKNTITFFGTTAFGNPFQGGFLCVKPTLFRLGVKNSGGAAQCQGTVSYTLAELQAHGSGGATVVPGADVYCQTWGRDPGDSFGSSLSNGVTFMVLP